MISHLIILYSSPLSVFFQAVLQTLHPQSLPPSMSSCCSLFVRVALWDPSPTVVVLLSTSVPNVHVVGCFHMWSTHPKAKTLLVLLLLSNALPPFADICLM